MGLDKNGTKFLLYARGQGVSFHETAMVGRQTLNVDAEGLRDNLRRFGFQSTDEEVKRILTDSDGYAETFLKLLGAREIASFDASDYENASQIHDFNLPIPDRFKNRFSVVLDGGTLEHIFNFPTAIRNCMEMVAEGGHFLGITPTNNFLGHGFYQFSPELFFRIFNRANGFEMRRLILFEDYPESDWYEVTDPDAVRERVILINNQPSYLLVIARKNAAVPIFENAPQQSDYFALWKTAEKGSATPESLVQKSSEDLIRRLLRLPLSSFRLARRRLEHSFGMLKRRPQHYKKIDLP